MTTNPACFIGNTVHPCRRISRSRIRIILVLTIFDVTNGTKYALPDQRGTRSWTHWNLTHSTWTSGCFRRSHNVNYTLWIGCWNQTFVFRLSGWLHNFRDHVLLCIRCWRNQNFVCLIGWFHKSRRHVLLVHAIWRHKCKIGRHAVYRLRCMFTGWRQNWIIFRIFLARKCILRLACFRFLFFCLLFFLILDRPLCPQCSSNPFGIHSDISFLSFLFFFFFFPGSSSSVSFCHWFFYDFIMFLKLFKSFGINDFFEFSKFRPVFRIQIIQDKFIPFVPYITGNLLFNVIGVFVFCHSNLFFDRFQNFRQRHPIYHASICKADVTQSNQQCRPIVLLHFLHQPRSPFQSIWKKLLFVSNLCEKNKNFFLFCSQSSFDAGNKSEVENILLRYSLKKAGSEGMTFQSKGLQMCTQHADSRGIKKK